jgi:hypothetical protein
MVLSRSIVSLAILSLKLSLRMENASAPSLTMARSAMNVWLDSKRKRRRLKMVRLSIYVSGMLNLNSITVMDMALSNKESASVRSITLETIVISVLMVTCFILTAQKKTQIILNLLKAGKSLKRREKKSLKVMLILEIRLKKLTVFSNRSASLLTTQGHSIKSTSIRSSLLDNSISQTPIK